VFAVVPTGDGQGRMIALDQPVTLRAMEALFVGQPGAPLDHSGAAKCRDGKRSKPLEVPDALSF